MLHIHCTNKTSASILVAMLCCVYAHAQFSPADVSGLQLWLRADSGITLNGNFVAQWDDQSGNDNHATSEFDVIRPTLLDDALNGLPAVSFDGSEDFMQFPLIDDVRTVFWVLRENANSTNAPPRPLLGWSGGLTYLRGDNKEFWNGNFADPAVFNGGTRLNLENINGSQTIVPTDFCITSLVTTAPLNATHLTMELNIFGRTWWGEMAEVLIYNVPLSTEEIAQVETYLADKYTHSFTDMNDINVEYGFCDTLICAPDGYASYLWNGVQNEQCITVSAAGQYTLQMTDVFGRSVNDTIQVTFPGNLQIPDATICLGDSFLWDTQLNEGDYAFQWSNSTDQSEVIITEENDYTLMVTDTNACNTTAAFHIGVDLFSTLATLGEDASLCAGNTIGFTQEFTGLSYIWSTDETSSSIVINETGDYWLEAQNENNCIARDTLHVEIIGVAPSISFSATGLCENGATDFAANNFSSSNITLWHWNFGDGTDATGQNVAHTYATSADYVVELTATTIEGCSQLFQQVIHINAQPVAQFANALACDNAPIEFSSTSTSEEGNIVEWQWLIDGIFYTGAQVSALIDDNGLQSVLLAVTTDLGCAAEITQSVNIAPSPAAAFNTDATCEGELTQFAEQVDETQSGPIQQYLWSFGDNTGSSLPNPSHFYSQGGEYEVNLIAIAVNGCNDTTTQTVIIYNLPVADFVITNACQNVLYTFQNSSTSVDDVINAWNWEVSGETIAEENPSVIFYELGLQPIQLSVTTTHGCTASVEQQVPVWPVPEAAFSFEPEIDDAPFECQLINESTGATDAQWLFGDTFESTEYNPLHIFTLSGTAYTQLIAISAAGCRDTTGQIIHIASPVLDVMIQSVQCTPTDFGQQITTELINTGNITIHQLILSYAVGNDAPILEVWNGELLPASPLLYTFSAYMQQVGQQFPYVCITAETSPIEYTETNLTDNQYCKPLENVGLEVFPPYPNPGDDRMFVRFITPVAGDLQLFVFDMKGNLVMDLEDEAVPKGYHQYFLDISALAEGSYKLQLEMNTARSVVSFLKMKSK